MPTTLTGSIGVFGIVPTFDESLKSLGIHSDGVGSTRLADIGHLDRPLSEEARVILQLGVDNIYQRFLTLVAEGRGTTVEAVTAVAGGRVWTGRQALERGLVDGLGTFADAINAAGLRAGLKRWEVKYIERPLSFQEQLLKQLAGSAVSARQWLAPATGLPAPLSPRLRDLAEQILAIGRLNDPRGLYLHCFGCDQP
jgi:protease-4